MDNAESNVCRFCGISKENARKFYKTIGKKPWFDQIYFCDRCKITLEKANWFRNREVEEIKK